MTRQHHSHGTGDREPARRGRNQREHQISVRAIRRSPTDLRKLGRAIIEIEIARAEAEARAEADHNDNNAEASDE